MEKANEGIRDEKATLAAAVREALTHLGHKAPPREVARYLRVVFPAVRFKEKTLYVTVAKQRQALRTDGEARVSDLLGVGTWLAERGMTAGEMLARLRDEDDLALGVGGRLELVQCLGLLARLREPRCDQAGRAEAGGESCNHDEVGQ